MTEIFEELRIVPQDLWEAAHAELTRRSATTTTSDNSNTARRSKHLLTGLMVCDTCGAPYVKVGHHRFGCREARKWACDNRETIRNDRIEARIFGQLRSQLIGPELLDIFEAAYHAELRALDGADVETTVKTVTGQLVRVRKARRGIMSAIENGADFADYSGRDRELKAEEADLDRRLLELRARQAAKDRPPPDIPAIFESALREMEALLGDPNLVDQANGQLRSLIRSITLKPDPKAEDGLAAEIQMDLGSLRSRVGLTDTTLLDSAPL